MRVSALIPAKSFSRRLPGKNLKMLAGKPLFLYSVELAQSVEAIDAVYVSSDSPEILAQATGRKVIGMQRPPELCTDAATNFQVMCHHLTLWRERGEEPDILVLLQATSPFRTAQPLAEMIELFRSDTAADSLVTVAWVARLRGHVFNGYWVTEGGKSGGRLQSVRESSEFTGHVVMVRPRKTLDQGVLLGARTLAAPLPASWPDIDIDTPRDWRLAEAYAATLAMDQPFWMEK